MSTTRERIVNVEVHQPYPVIIAESALATLGRRLAAQVKPRKAVLITDDVVGSFGILGTPEQHVEKLKALEAAGVTQFTIYLMCGEEERIVAEYGEHVIPHFQ